MSKCKKAKSIITLFGKRIFHIGFDRENEGFLIFSGKNGKELFKVNSDNLFDPKGNYFRDVDGLVEVSSEHKVNLQDKQDSIRSVTE